MSRHIKARVSIRKRGKLFRRYFKYMLALVICCTVFVGGFVALFTSNYWLDSCVNNLQDHTGVIAARTEAFFLNSPDSDAITDMRLALCSELTTTSEHDNADVYLVNADGTVLLCRHMLSSDLTHFRLDTCPEHSKIRYPKAFLDNLALKKTISDRGTLAGVYDSLTFFAASGIYVNGKMVGFVAAAQPVSVGIKEFIGNYAKILVTAVGLLLVVSFIFSYILAYTITNPVTEMSETMKIYSKGNFEQRIEAKGDDEMADLAEAFNSMADALAANETARRSFVANVSHELRTPMTTIGGFVDGMLDGTITYEMQPKYLKIVSDEVKRLTRLISSMLNMSKIEAGELKLKAVDFNMCELIFTTLLSFEKKLSDRKIDVQGLDKFGSFTVNADMDMINQVIYNLIENAVKYTPEGQVISVSAEDVDGKTTVRIRNYGVGLSQEQCNMIFERFYKVDKSRSLDVKSVGLGLYICKNVVELHGGKIGCRSDGRSFTEFYFTIPTRQPTK